MAEKEKIKHALKYPGYTYEPNRKKMGSEKTKPKKTKPKKTNPKKRKSKKKGPEKWLLFVDDHGLGKSSLRIIDSQR